MLSQMKRNQLLGLCLTAGLLGSVSTHAQSSGQTPQEQVKPSPALTGRILDAEGKPLALATVALIGADGGILDGAVVGDDGAFALRKHLPKGKSLRVQMQSYETQHIPLKEGVWSLGDIRLKPSATALGEVEVKAGKRQAFKMQGVSLTASIASTSLGNLPSVINMLAALPFVSATQQSVEVQGRGTPIIYYGHQRISQEELLRLNPKDVKDIEVILVPDASYPAGTPAVIKIKPKSLLSRRLGVYTQQSITKDKEWGYRSMVQGYYDTPKMSLKLGGQLMSNPSYLEQELRSQLTDEARPTTQSLKNQQNIRNSPGVAWADAVYRLSDKHEVGGKLQIVRLLGLDVDVNIQTELSLASGVEKRYNSKLIKEQENPMTYYLLNGYYHGTLAPKWTVHAEGNYYQRKEKFHQVMDVRYTQPQGATDREESYSWLDGGTWSWRTYVEHSIKGGKLQLGHDGSTTQATQNYQQVELSKQQILPSTETQHTQTNLGFFATWQQAWSPSLSTQVGLRLEEQSSRNKLFARTVREERKWYFYPSLTLAYNKGAFSGNLTYENIVRNVPYQALRNDILYIDELKLQGGNPLLKPRIDNKLSLTLGYQGLTLVGHILRSKNVYHIQIAERYQADPSRVILRPENFDLTNYRLGLAYSKQIGPWRPTWSVDMYIQDFTYLGHNYNKPIFEFWFKNFLMLPAGFMLQANVELKNTGEYGNYEQKGWWGVDLNLMKRFGKAWTLSLNANDLFASRDYHTITQFAISRGEQINHQLYPTLSLSATYNFQARQNRYRGGTAGQAEQGRF